MHRSFLPQGSIRLCSLALPSSSHLSQPALRREGSTALTLFKTPTHAHRLSSILHIHDIPIPQPRKEGQKQRLVVTSKSVLTLQPRRILHMHRTRKENIDRSREEGKQASRRFEQAFSKEAAAPVNHPSITRTLPSSFPPPHPSSSDFTFLPLKCRCITRPGTLQVYWPTNSRNFTYMSGPATQKISSAASPVLLSSLSSFSFVRSFVTAVHTP